MPSAMYSPSDTCLWQCTPQQRTAAQLQFSRSGHAELSYDRIKSFGPTKYGRLAAGVSPASCARKLACVKISLQNNHDTAAAPCNCTANTCTATHAFSNVRPWPHMPSAMCSPSAKFLNNQKVFFFVFLRSGV